MRNFYTFIVCLLILFSCDNKSSQYMPTLTTDGKWLRIENDAFISGVRNLNISAKYEDETNKNKRRVVFDWESETWNNFTNKPILLISVGDKLYEVPKANYDYKKRYDGSSIHISYNLKHREGDDIVKFYLCNKNLYDKNTKTLTFKDQNKDKLIPLNSEKNKLEFIFTATTTINNLRQNRPVNFRPLGTIILFEKESVIDDDSKYLTVTTDCFDFSCQINPQTGMNTVVSSATNPVKTTKRFKIKKGKSDKSIYGIYCLGKNVNSGTFEIKNHRGTVYSYNIESTPLLSGKFINLQFKDNDSFVIRFDYTSVDQMPKTLSKLTAKINEETFLKYRKVGETEWQTFPLNFVNNPDGITKTADFDIKNVIGEVTPFELRVVGINHIEIPKLGQVSDDNFMSDANSVRVDCPVTVVQWGTNKWESMERMFYNFKDFKIATNEIPDLSECKTMRGIFASSGVSHIDNIDKWDMSNVEDMGYMFANMYNFNQDITNWDTSNAKDMSGMFYNAISFDQPIGRWNTSKVRNMSNMFNGATKFNQRLHSWKTDNVITMAGMFKNAKTFDRPINFWNTSNVIDMSNLFNGATKFNQGLNSWITDNVVSMAGMFKDAINFNQPITFWKTSNVKDMSSMFMNAKNFDQEISWWDVSNVTDISNMFNGAVKFNQRITNWDTKKVTNMEGVFMNAISFNTSLYWDTSKVVNMKNMFNGASRFFQNLAGWRVRNVKNHEDMFKGCYKMEWRRSYQPTFWD